MTGSTRLVVWRHGKTGWNGENRVQGQSDTPLSDAGREQAARAASLLAGLRPDAVVSSDLSRASATAHALARLVGLPVRYDERLRERYYGQWQGRTMAEISRMFPVEHSAWRAGDAAPGCGIERLDEVAKRMGEALQEIVDQVAGGTVVVAAHGGCAKQGIGALLGWLPETIRTLGGLDNCHWAELRRTASGWRLWSYNVGVSTRVEPPLPA